MLSPTVFKTTEKMFQLFPPRCKHAMPSNTLKESCCFYKDNVSLRVLDSIFAIRDLNISDDQAWLPIEIKQLRL